MPILRYNISGEISKSTFEISHRILNPYTVKYAFYKLNLYVRFTISLNCDVMCLNETGPWRPVILAHALLQLHLVGVHIYQLRHKTYICLWL